VEEEARQQGFAIMILQSRNNPEIEAANLRLCRINHVAGVFLAVNSIKENLAAYKKIEDWDIPMVFFDKVPSEGPFNKVCMADEQAGALAAQKIYEAGYSKIIAVMGSETMSITLRRLKGIRQFLSENAPSLRLEVIFTENGEAVPGLMESKLKSLDKDTAVFSMSDEILCGVIKFFNQHGLRFPDDAGLLTISNGFFPGLFSPQIDYVETNGSKLGSLAFSRMKEIMDGKKFIRENLLGCQYFGGGSLKAKP
jgi:LacI family transcriptional regulator